MERTRIPEAQRQALHQTCSTIYRIRPVFAEVEHFTAARSGSEEHPRPDLVLVRQEEREKLHRDSELAGPEAKDVGNGRKLHEGIADGNFEHILLRGVCDNMHEICVRDNTGCFPEALTNRAEFHHEIVDVDSEQHPVVFGAELAPIYAAVAAVR